MLTDSQYNAISRIYDARRSDAMRLKDSRINELYEAVPEIKEIDDELSSGSVSAGILALRGNPTELNLLRRKNDGLIEKKKKLIVKAGYPENYLDDIYYCPLCKDTGKTETGRCECYDKTVINEFFLDADRRELLNREQFNTIKLEMYSEDVVDLETGKTERVIAQDSLISALNFTENFGKSFTNLLISGNTGTGKTHLANAIAKKLIDNGVSVLYLSATDFFELCKKLKMAQFEDYKHAETELNFVLGAECLIIDDLGTEAGTGSTHSQLFNCIEKRFLKKLPTVITTNLSKEDLGARYSDRIKSRLLSNYKYLKMPGDDNRLKRGF